MSDAHRPVVSVVVPTFNRARYLPDALNSIGRQDVADVETLVIDDGSTDDTQAVVARHHLDVRYVRTTHRGAAAARNTGVRLAAGRFISFLDSDDVWMPGKTKAELAIFDENPGADAVISDCEKWMENDLLCTSWFAERGLCFARDDATPLSPMPPLWLKGKLFATCCLTVRRAALDRVGLPLFDTSLVTHEDWDLAIRLHHSCSIIAVPRVLAQVRRFDDGSRVGRPIPGTEYPPAAKSVMALRRCRIFDRAHRMRGWPDGVVPHIRAAASESAREFVENLVGWRRRGLAAVVAGELRHGAFTSAATIMTRGLMPQRARSLLKATAPAAGSGQR